LESAAKTGAFSYPSPKALLVMEGLQMRLPAFYILTVKKIVVFLNVKERKDSYQNLILFSFLKVHFQYELLIHHSHHDISNFLQLGTCWVSCLKMLRQGVSQKQGRTTKAP